MECTEKEKERERMDDLESKLCENISAMIDWMRECNALFLDQYMILSEKCGFDVRKLRIRTCRHTFTTSASTRHNPNVIVVDHLLEFNKEIT